MTKSYKGSGIDNEDNISLSIPPTSTHLNNMQFNIEEYDKIFGSVVKKEIWTNEQLDVLKEWKAKIFAYMWMQNESSYYYIAFYNWLAYLIIISSSFAGATMFSINSFQSDCDTSYGIPSIYIQYFIGSISLISAILTGVIRHLKPGENHQQHINTARKYNIIIRSINETLLIRPNISPVKYLEDINDKMEAIISNQKDPPRYVIKKFENIFGSIDRILYGEDIIELYKMKVKNKKELNKFRV